MPPHLSFATPKHNSMRRSADGKGVGSVHAAHTTHRCENCHTCVVLPILRLLVVQLVVLERLLQGCSHAGPRRAAWRLRGTAQRSGPAQPGRRAGR
jgi:hypothetical protein